MRAAGTPFESQARLWLVAFVASALVNALGLVVIGLGVISKIEFRPSIPAPPPMETVAMIVPMVAEEVPVEAPAEPAATSPSFARTSPDQAERVPEKPDFIGERDTSATSESPSQAADPKLPDQQGREPRWEDEIETTESNYQDGDLASNRVARPNAPSMPEAANPAEAEHAAEAAKQAGTEGATSELPETVPARERLAEGPVPVDRMVKEETPEESPKPTPPQRKVEGEDKTAEKDQRAEQPKPSIAPSDPGFRGNQRKTRLVGSLSRIGRSALNVENSALGRYHAAVSRAVEKEWQRNCVRNRDFIVPGQLTLSFVLDASGAVRSKFIVEDFGVGDIQKGFTLNSIRDAEIPAMPNDLKKQLDGESLELIYRFNF